MLSKKFGSGVGNNPHRRWVNQVNVNGNGNDDRRGGYKPPNGPYSDNRIYGEELLDMPYFYGLQAFQPVSQLSLGHANAPPTPQQQHHRSYQPQLPKQEFGPSLGEQIYNEPMNQVFISVLSTTSLLLLTFAWFRAAEKVLTYLTVQMFGKDDNLIWQAILTTVLVMAIHSYIVNQSPEHAEQLKRTLDKQKSFLGI
jgi:hypothetical protein